MAKTTHDRQITGARERLASELQAEAQRVKDACFRMTRIDPENDPGRYEALVSKMLDAVDRQAAFNADPRTPQGAEAQADLFEGIELESEALNALIAQLRCLSSGDVQSNDRYFVLSNYVNTQRSRGRDLPARADRPASIDWEALGLRMDAMRKRLYGQALGGSGHAHGLGTADARRDLER